MNVLASTSTACYTCVLARAVAVNPARFSTSIKSHREGGIWKGKKRPDPSLEQTRSLIEELRRLNKEDGVQVDNSVFATGPRDRSSAPEEPENKPHWRLHRESLKEKFPEGWNPPRRLSRGEMNTIRRLHGLDTEKFSTPNLAEQFKISAEAVRRILKSKFRTDEEIDEEKVGDELLKEAELGAYDKSQNSTRLSRFSRPSMETKPKYSERKTKPAQPLQDGFDASKMSSNYKWAAGRRSNVATARPTYLERNWEDSRRGGIDNRAERGQRSERDSGSRPTFRSTPM